MPDQDGVRGSDRPEKKSGAAQELFRKQVAEQILDDGSVKDPKAVKVALTNDGGIIIELNYKLYPHTSKMIITGDALLDLADEYGEIPPADETDYPGVPVVDSYMIFDDDEDGEDEPSEEE